MEPSDNGGGIAADLLRRRPLSVPNLEWLLQKPGRSSGT